MQVEFLEKQEFKISGRAFSFTPQRIKGKKGRDDKATIQQTSCH